METIAFAAIRYNGKIFLGWRHCWIGLAMVRNGDCPTPYPGGDDQGFVTSTGRFVQRVEALQLAKDSGVVIVKHGNKGHLFSEDLWNTKGVPYTSESKLGECE